MNFLKVLGDHVVFTGSGSWTSGASTKLASDSVSSITTRGFCEPSLSSDSIVVHLQVEIVRRMSVKLSRMKEVRSVAGEMTGYPYWEATKAQGGIASPVGSRTKSQLGSSDHARMHTESHYELNRFKRINGVVQNAYYYEWQNICTDLVFISKICHKITVNIQ